MLTKHQEKTANTSHPQAARATKAAGHKAISRDEMIDLFDYLEDGLVADACDHSLRYTESFLAARGIELKPAIEWIRQFGATCDCEILQNVELEWGGPL